MIAASFKAWNKRDCHPKQAILDSGASDHFLSMSYKGNYETPTSDGITVTCANGGRLKATATDIMNLQRLPVAATTCHKFLNNQLVDPLLSLKKLTAHGCPVVFKKDTVEVINRDGLLILVGHKPLGRNIYAVPLPLGHSENIPRNIRFTKNITPVKGPKISQDTSPKLPIEPSEGGLKIITDVTTVPKNISPVKPGPEMQSRVLPEKHQKEFEKYQSCGTGTRTTTESHSSGSYTIGGTRTTIKSH